MRASVVGFGVTGKAVAEYLRKNGYDVFISEKKYVNGIEEYEHELVHTEKINDCEIIVLSPGVDIKKLGFIDTEKVISEVELAYRNINKNSIIIGITGTNGKTTTTLFIEHILKKSGVNAVACGNIGYPFIKAVEEKFEVYVVELSSYQLEYIIDFKPYIACILNITPDHLEHHGSFEKYKAAKFNITKNQTSSDWIILRSDIELTTKAKKIHFDLNMFDGENILYEGMKFPKPENLIGMHNIENTISSIMVSSIYGCSYNSIVQAIKTFKPPPHRLEFVCEINGVKYINDSKSTNLASTIAAINAVDDDNITLIIGGMKKKESFKELAPYIDKKVSNVILIGVDAYEIYEDIKDVAVNIYNPGSLERAVEWCIKNLESGSVLFSPGCASFDRYTNFEERGNSFKDLLESKIPS